MIKDVQDHIFTHITQFTMDYLHPKQVYNFIPTDLNIINGKTWKSQPKMWINLNNDEKLTVTRLYILNCASQSRKLCQ